MIVLNKNEKKTAKKVISIRLDPNLIDRLDSIANENDSDRSKVITEILEKVVPKIRIVQ